MKKTLNIDEKLLREAKEACGAKDTSVWIRVFAGREPYLSEARRLSSREQAAGHDLVFGELLIGDRGGRHQFLTQYLEQYQAPTVPHDEVVTLVRVRRLNGRGIGWGDAHLLASAMAGRMQLWTADSTLAEVAAELGVAYRP